MSLEKGFYIYKTFDVVTILPSSGEDRIMFNDISSYEVFDNMIKLVNKCGIIKEIPTV